MADDCLRRAIRCGLAFMGQAPDLSWIPENAGIETVEKLCDDWGLVLISGPYKTTNDPVLVIYDMERGNTGDGRKITHAVFASDIHPFLKYNIQWIVTGWE